MSLRTALTLSVADRRWIDFITQSVNETWDDANPGRPKTMGYVGSEEFIRLQFEEYLLSLISSVKCHNYLLRHANNPSIMLPQVEGDPAHDFGTEWIDAWTHSENHRIWDSYTDSHLFDIVEPKHPCAGGLTIDDVQRRIAAQVQEFHLDERFAVGKEVLGRNLAAGKEKASTVFNKLYADMEALRESQRRKNEEAKAANGGVTPTTPAFAPDLTKAQQTVQTVGNKAGAYMSSWATWAGEKRRSGWGRSASATAPAKNKPTPALPPQTEKALPVTPTRSLEAERPKTQESYQESLFDAESVHHMGHSGEEIKKQDILTGTPATEINLSPAAAASPPAPPSPPAAHEKAIEEASSIANEWAEEVALKTNGSSADHDKVTEEVQAAAATPISS